jgi:glycerophosphoryl diester phosphodiesterase
MGVVSDASGLKAAMAFLPLALFLAAVFWMMGIVLHWQPMQWPKQALSLPQLQAHRGYRPKSDVRENTLEAFRQARAAGAVMTECDVRISRDRVPVVFHDYDLRRLGGSEQKVTDLTAQELQIKVGAPTLRELLLDPESPEFLNVELKTTELRGLSGLEVEVVRAIREVGAQNRVMFSSFNPFALRRLAVLAPEIPRALLVTEEREPKNYIWLRQMWLAFWARPNMVNVDDKMVNEDFVRGLRDRGVPFSVWTVNDLDRAQQLLKMGATSVITDVCFAETSASITSAVEV